MDLAQGRGRGAMVRAIVGVALILLVHNIVALFAAGAALLVAVFAWRAQGDPAAPGRIARALAAAVALTAFCDSLMHVGEVSTDRMSHGAYGFDVQGIYPFQLLGTGFGASIPGPDDR